MPTTVVNQFHDVFRRKKERIFEKVQCSHCKSNKWSCYPFVIILLVMQMCICSAKLTSTPIITLYHLFLLLGNCLMIISAEVRGRLFLLHQSTVSLFPPHHHHLLWLQKNTELGALNYNEHIAFGDNLVGWRGSTRFSINDGVFRRFTFLHPLFSEVRSQSTGTRVSLRAYAKLIYKARH